MRTDVLLELVLGNLGTLVALCVAVVAFFRGWVVRGSEYEKVKEQRDRLIEERYQDAKESQEIARALLRREQA